MHLGTFRSATTSTTTPEMEIMTSQAMDENGMKMDLGLAKIVHHSGQIIVTKPPVGHPKMWFSKGIAP